MRRGAVVSSHTNKEIQKVPEIKLNLDSNVDAILAAVESAYKINAEQILGDVSKQAARATMAGLETPSELATEAIRTAVFSGRDTDELTDFKGEFVAAIAAGAGLERYAIPDEDDLRREEIAITRAKIVQKEIIRLRESLKNGHHEGKLLASYDAELGRLCQVPGVMAALLDNTKV